MLDVVLLIDGAKMLISYSLHMHSAQLMCMCVYYFTQYAGFMATNHVRQISVKESLKKHKYSKRVIQNHQSLGKCIVIMWHAGLMLWLTCTLSL